MEHHNETCFRRSRKEPKQVFTNFYSNIMYMYILKKAWEQGKYETFLPPNFVETPDYFSLQYIHKERNATHSMAL